MARRTRRPFRSPLRRKASAPGLLSRVWRVVRLPILLAITLGLWWFAIRPVTVEQGWERVDHRFALCGERRSGPARELGCVVDGDTLSLGFGQARRRIRLTGFDAPEMEGACDAESARAREARRFLQQWLARGAFEWDGAPSPPRDQYGRELREVRRTAPDGSAEHLADTMIEAGLAGGSGWGSWPVDWCE